MNKPITAQFIRQVPDRKTWMPYAPYFLAAYRPHDGRWYVFADLYASDDGIDISERINQLQNGGWVRVTVMRLPPELGK